MKNITRLFDIIDYTLKTYNNKVAIAGKNDDVWYAYSHQEYKKMADNLSYGLMESGIKPCDKIATITGNCPEWNIVDLAILQIGAIHVPIYPNISDAEYDYILNHAEVKMVFVAGMDMYERIKTILPNILSLKKIYTFKNIYGFEHFNELIKLGKQNPKQEELQKIKESIGKNDLATLIYTSGTTGQPKGVMLSHNNLLSNAKAVISIPPNIHGWKILSFLPLCHVYERMMNYMFQIKGYSIYYVENPGRLSKCVGEIKPNIIYLLRL
ncbi:MAG: hypothetical protein CVT98_11040 [Bacteroidetes bacterium HGW-Bacteroidetes-15]|nr:MAG: hypothetical protein CVT98_11040 [Bacteroidetes bacterium HGW-Bacteroidetes-15]